MHNDLIPYVTGDLRPSRQNRELVNRARSIYDDVALTRVKVDGAMALAGHVMEGVTMLDAHRRALAGNNAPLNSLLSSIELETVLQVQSIQHRLFSPFGF